MENFFESPKSVQQAYEDGLIGSYCDKDELDQLMGELKHPVFSIAAHNLYGTGEGKVSLPFKCLLKLDPNFGPAEAQTTGDCQNGSDLVKMADGTVKLIKDIVIGDYVISAHGKKRLVTNTFKKPYHKEMIELTLEDETIIASTPDHRYIINNITMEDKAILELLVGDKVFNPQLGRMVAIRSIRTVNPEDSFVYCIEVEVDHNFICNNIGILNCVSHSTRNAVDISRAVEIFNGEVEDFVVRGATEGIYGSRGHSGQGMSCAQSARFVNSQGGILLRKKYSFADLSKYDSRIGSNWGARGVPKELLQEASKNQVKTVSMVHNVIGARDAIANGYALSVCSNAGFSSVRDKNGISGTKGSWNHAMSWIAADDSRELFDEILFCVQNSWGAFNSGPRRHGQPEGSFWIRQSVAERMLAQDGAFVFSNIDGFKPRKLDYSVITEVL